MKKWFTDMYGDSTGLTELNKGTQKMDCTNTSYSGFISVHPQTLKFSYKHPTSPKMTRLATSGDWTIAINESNKLVAFDSNGTTITATGSLLSADGKAWMWKDGYLWSGVLEMMLTEKQVRLEAKIQAEERIRNKYYNKIQKLMDKQDELHNQQTRELMKL